MRRALILLLAGCAGAPESILPGQAPNGAYGPTVDEETWSVRLGPGEDAATTAVTGLALAACGELDRAREAARYCLSRPDLTVAEYAATMLLLTQLVGEMEDPEIDARLREGVERIANAKRHDGTWPLRWNEVTPNRVATAMAITALRQAGRDGPEADLAPVWAGFGEAGRILTDQQGPMPLFLRPAPAGPARGRILLAAKRPTWRARAFAAKLAHYDATVVYGDAPVASRDFDLVILDGHDPAPWRALNVAVRDSLDEPVAVRPWVRVEAVSFLIGAEVAIEAHGSTDADVHGPDGTITAVRLTATPTIADRYRGSFLAVRVGSYRVVLKGMEESTAFQIVAPP